MPNIIRRSVIGHDLHKRFIYTTLILMIIVMAFIPRSESSNGPSYGLEQTFLNPSPESPAGYEAFGFSLAVLGEDVLVGSPYESSTTTGNGAVYLFDGETGALLHTFLNPTPNERDRFGESVASAGDNVLIGAYGDDTVGTDAGAAYLFDARTGDHIQSFFNPTPNEGDWFGRSVAFMGDNVLIGAPTDDTAGENAGAAYLFDAQTGDLIYTFMHSYPTAEDRFGFSVAAIGEKVLASAIFDNTVGTDAGAVFLFAESTPPDFETILWVSSSPDSVKRYDGQTGDYIDDFASTGDAGRPVDFTFGPDGNLYVSVPATDEIKRFNGQTGEFIDNFVTSGSGGLEGPAGLRFGPDGNLYVSSVWTHQVKRYDGTTGAFIDNFASGGGLNRPTWLFWWNDLYVSSLITDDVKRYDYHTGEFIDNFVTAGSGGLAGPDGLIFQGDGYLYVVSSESNEVKRYDEDTGEFIDNFVTAGSGGLDTPIDLQFAGGDLYVTSFGTHEVKRYDGESGAFIDNFVSAGSGGLNGPEGLRILIVREPQPETDGVTIGVPIIIIVVLFVIFVSTVVWRFRSR